MIKPPLGIMPRHIWIENRLTNLEAVIMEHVMYHYPVKEEWIQEYNQLLKELNV